MAYHELGRGPSASDLALEMANDRIHTLHGDARRARLAGNGSADGAVRRFRDALGRRLIALGSAIAVERPPQHLPHPQRRSLVR